MRRVYIKFYITQEKIAKDKARINHQLQEVNPEDVHLSVLSHPQSDSGKHSEHKKHSHKCRYSQMWFCFLSTQVVYQTSDLLHQNWRSLYFLKKNCFPNDLITDWSFSQRKKKLKAVRQRFWHFYYDSNFFYQKHLSRRQWSHATNSPAAAQSQDNTEWSLPCLKLI